MPFPVPHQGAHKLVNIVTELFCDFQRHLQESAQYLRVLYKLRLLFLIGKKSLS